MCASLGSVLPSLSGLWWCLKVLDFSCSHLWNFKLKGSWFVEWHRGTVEDELRDSCISHSVTFAEHWIFPCLYWLDVNSLSLPEHQALTHTHTHTSLLKLQILNSGAEILCFLTSEQWCEQIVQIVICVQNQDEMLKTILLWKVHWCCWKSLWRLCSESSQRWCCCF